MLRDDALSLITHECEKKVVVLSGEEADLLYRRTGGVPLAIVWSIAQIGYGYGVEAVLRRLGQPAEDVAHYCFDGTVERIRNSPAHKLLIALTLFAADASREALGVVTDLSEQDRDEALVACERLSLVNKQADRFMMLPLTRQYMEAEAAGQETWRRKAREKQTDYLEQQLDSLLQKSYQGLNDYALDRDNLLHHLEWLWAQGQYPDYIRLAEKMDFFLWTTGDWSIWNQIALRAYKASLELDDAHSKAEFSYILAVRSLFAGDLDEALDYARQAEDQFQRLHDETSYAEALTRTGWILSLQENLDGAEAKHQAALEIFSRLGDNRHVARTQRGLAYVDIRRKEFGKAREHLQVAQSLREKTTRFSSGLAVTYRMLGEVALGEGNLEEARKNLLISLSIAQHLKIVQDTAEAKLALAVVEAQAGDLEQAKQLAQEAEDTFDRLGMKGNLAKARELAQGIRQDVVEAARIARGLLDMALQPRV